MRNKSMSMITDKPSPFALWLPVPSFFYPDICRQFGPSTMPKSVLHWLQHRWVRLVMNRSVPAAITAPPATSVIATHHAWHRHYDVNGNEPNNKTSAMPNEFGRGCICLMLNSDSNVTSQFRGWSGLRSAYGHKLSWLSPFHRFTVVRCAHQYRHRHQHIAILL